METANLRARRQPLQNAEKRTQADENLGKDTAKGFLMNDWKSVLIAPETPILHAIRVIDEGALAIALAVDPQGKLLGTITDGDVRRAILKGISLDSPVREIMNSNPVTVSVADGDQAAIQELRRMKLNLIPIVDEAGVVVSVRYLHDVTAPEPKLNRVVLMAGGLGSRLEELTEKEPKPLLRVGKSPILETILKNFMDHGFKNFSVAVNYKAEMIKDYFGNGARYGVNINYLQENQRLGTAGALSLIQERPTAPILVMNGDLLTKVNFTQLLEFHQSHGGVATMGVREYDFRVPFGVVTTEDQYLTSIDEKPLQSFFVNAGIYVLEPEALEFVPKNKEFDMPQLFNKLIEKKYKAAAFPIREYWLDIGRKPDLEQAQIDIEKITQ